MIRFILFAYFICFGVASGNALIQNFLPGTTLEQSKLFLEAINGSRIYRMHGKKGKDDKTWFDGRERQHFYCVRPAKCELLKEKTCLGSSLPYSSTSLDLTDFYKQEQALSRLHSYQALRHVPKCWAVIQPFLCAVFLPQCERFNNTDMVYLPSLEMCKITLEPCRILYNTTYFPEFLKCNENMFPARCNNEAKELKFNATSGQCLKPLVHTDISSSFYKDIDGCGVQCKDPLYTEDEHRQIHKLIAWGCGICLMLNVFTIATFIIDWKNANKYPALVIFYINFCYMISCFGWLAQFTPGGREDIVCRKDGTIRHGEPSAGENLSCIIVFILVYYFLIAAMVWFVIFTYVWHMSIKAIGQIQDRINKKGSYFHLIAWSLPLVLTISIMAMSEVDGNSVVGICFVGYLNHAVRGAFLIGPICAVLLIGGYFLSRGMLTLIKLKMTSKDLISVRASNMIKQTIVRMAICTILTLLFIFATFVCHFHEFKHSNSWSSNLKNYIICQISSTYTDNVHSACIMENRPSVAMLQLHLICLFSSGIVMSSWVWTNSTIETWSRYFRRQIGQDTDEPVKLQKHKVIAQAFAKRREFQNQGRLSISFHNSHTDPVGLNFDINSAAGSHDFSSTWANNLPRFVNRRYALTGVATSSSHGPRKNSVDSEISFSVRHVSVESRRNSIDSQVSVKIAEMKTKVASRTTRGSTTGKSKARHHRRRDFSTANARRYGRKESSTSVESQIITAIQKARHPHSNVGVKTCNTFNQTSNKNYMKRRTGIGDINDLITNSKLLLPFLHNQGLTTSDDDYDNISMTSVKVQDSRLDVILRQIERQEMRTEYHNNDDDDDDDDDDENLDNMHRASGVHVQEYNTSDDENNAIQKSNESKYSNYLEAVENTALKTSRDSFKNNGRSSKNSIKSLRSKKANSRATKNSRTASKSLLRHEKKDKEKEKEKEKEMDDHLKDDDFNDSSFTSFCSELSPIGNPNVQSSYSGISITNSRNSKRSCDVGIQTNAHEIATQTQTISSYEFNEKNLKNEENEDIYTENHQLLPKRKDIAVIGNNNINKRRGDTEISMTENEKLKLLLLPSK